MAMRFLVLLGLLLLGFTGDVYAEDVPSSQDLPIVYVTAGTGLNLRTGPGVQHGIVGTVHCGRAVYEINRIEGWVRISLQEADRDSTAWVSEKYLSEAQPKCPELYSCHDCKRSTVNPPGVFGYSMCDRCMAIINEEATEYQRKVESLLS
jgi:hypothetical protein